MSRVYNFSAGPAVLPEEVLKEAAAEMMDYNGTGMSVMEMSHRSKAFEEIITAAEQDLRDLMNIPDNYKVLFLQGGASQQFAMIPMNLMKNKEADYIVTGQWAKKAAKEAAKYIVGEHDFASFCSSGSQVESTVRTVYRLEVDKNDDVISIIISGNGFLYNMVRIIVGTLIKVGLGVYPPEYVKEIIEAKDRNAAGPKAPACGLMLVKIDYED